jgi:hypothetical protein
MQVCLRAIAALGNELRNVTHTGMQAASANDVTICAVS